MRNTQRSVDARLKGFLAVVLIFQERDKILKNRDPFLTYRLR